MIERITPPKALVLQTPGINRDEATVTAFSKAGGTADIVPMSALLEGEVKLGDYQIFSIPGGFSYGDHIQAGRVLALELRQNAIADQLYEHLQKGRFVFAVCNGFQAVVQAGLLPFGQMHSLDQNVATLAHNEPNQFQSRWVFLKPQESRCRFVREDNPVTFPVAHGEGRFLTVNDQMAQQLIEDGQVVYQYCTAQGEPTQQYPLNPNGSVHAIAGICDPSGQILGMMPHAEDFVYKYNHPNARRLSGGISIDGLKFFQDIVKAAKSL